MAGSGLFSFVSLGQSLCLTGFSWTKISLWPYINWPLIIIFFFLHSNRMSAGHVTAQRVNSPALLPPNYSHETKVMPMQCEQKWLRHSGVLLLKGLEVSSPAAGRWGEQEQPSPIPYLVEAMCEGWQSCLTTPHCLLLWLPYEGEINFSPL